MINLYELKIDNVEFWRSFLTDNGEQAFKREKIKNYSLYLDKVKKLKDAPISEGENFIDLVSGRLILITEVGNDLIINPCGVRISKNRLIKCNNNIILKKAANILSNSENEYVSIAEDFEYNSFFCNRIAKGDNSLVISRQQVISEIIKIGQCEIEKEEYLERFYESEFSLFDFIDLFSLLSSIKKEISFDRYALVEFIAICKQNKKYLELLKDINVRFNGIFYFSDDLDEAITRLKFADVLYTITCEKQNIVFIKNNIYFSELKDKIDYFDKMNEFVDEFIIYQKEISNRHCDMLGQGDTKKINNTSKVLTRNRKSNN